MKRILSVLSLVVLLGSCTFAGFDWTLITRSSEQERLASHVVVGRLESFRQLETGSGATSRFAAQILIEGVEKGDGIASGERLQVMFHSTRSLDQLQTDRGVSSGCGDSKIIPLPGDRLRLYVLLDPSGDYVADYPQSFFYVENAEPVSAPAFASRWRLPGSLAAVAGALVLGVVSCRASARKRGR
jgi:hypothetical protein